MKTGLSTTTPKNVSSSHDPNPRTVVLELGYFGENRSRLQHTVLLSYLLAETTNPSGIPRVLKEPYLVTLGYHLEEPLEVALTDGLTPWIPNNHVMMALEVLSGEEFSSTPRLHQETIGDHTLLGDPYSGEYYHMKALGDSFPHVYSKRPLERILIDAARHPDRFMDEVVRPLSLVYLDSFGGSVPVRWPVGKSHLRASVDVTNPLRALGAVTPVNLELSWDESAPSYSLYRTLQERARKDRQESS